MSTKKTYTHTPYEESDAVKQAQALLQQQLSQKPGAYTSLWQDQLNQTLESLLSRPGFSYDLGSDALYQQYKDRYQTQGRLAMEDTMGKAAASTGGYGNSYAQTVGQQTYQSHLQGLNDLIPQLYQLALSRYQAEGDALQDRLSALQQRESTDYSRHQDALSAWQAERDFASNRYDAERNYDFGQYTSNRDFAYDQYTADRDYALRQEQLNQQQKQWQAEFDEALRQYELEYAQAQAKASSKSSGGGSYAGNGGYSVSQVRAAQNFVGAAADGMWGSKSRAAARAMGYTSLSQVIAAMGGKKAQTASTRPRGDKSLENVVNR